MANPQTENGHIRIANDFWEALAGAGLRGPEYAVLLAIIRETWGWQRKAGEVPGAVIIRLTGITDRSYISRITDRLAERKIITKKSEWKMKTVYAVNKNYDEWVVTMDTSVPMDSGTSTSTDSGTSTSTDRSVHYSKQVKQSKTSTTGGLPADARLVPIKDKYVGRLKTAMKANPAISFPTLTAQIRTALNARWKDEKLITILEVLDLFFEMADEWTRKKGWAFEEFLKQYNGLKAKVAERHLHPEKAPGYVAAKIAQEEESHARRTIQPIDVTS